MSQDQRVRLRDIARGALAGLGDTLTVNRGLLSLALANPERPGSIGLLLQKQAEKYPDRAALLFEDRRWSYAEFNAWVNRIASMLREQGVKPGDAVAILMENRPETLACVAAVVKLGAVAGMLNHQQRGEVLAHSLKLIDAGVLIHGEECAEAVASMGPALAQDGPIALIWDGSGHKPPGSLDLRAACRVASDANPAETAAVLQKQTAFYIFTSGTTGLPKASRMTHYRWLRGAAGLGQMALRLHGDDVFYCCLPLYHNNALTVSWGSVLASGCTLALAHRFSASRFWDDIRRHDATAFCYIGELLRYLLQRPESAADHEHRVRLIVGNGLRPELWDAFEQRFGIHQISEFYGASESNAAFINGFGLAKTAGFCPLPFAIVEFDAESETPVRDARGFMRKVAKGGVGLLLTEVASKTPFDGYTDRKASEAKLLRDVFKAGDCWVNSGDLVRDQGWRHIQFVDRIGDTFRWKGENVATTEVEAVLGSFPGVTEAVVYGVQVPNTDGRAGMAALTLVGELDGQALARHLAAHLPAYAVPLFLRLRTQQETTSTFKFRKVELKREGFDPARIDEPLYLLADRDRGYQALDAELYRRLQHSELRL
ncbi:MAG: long-chain-acyl-CoA synthetase [Stagnimonas sp.]|nr:long-chain-acyl-CoA synthetase [Stagnimonas sp.]